VTVRLDTADLAHLLLAIAALLVAAHLVGALSVRLAVPRVIGEIAGGLLAGPTVLGAIWPAGAAWLLPATGPVPACLDAIYQLGLLLLMFSAGKEVRSFLSRREHALVQILLWSGTLLPLAAGLLVVWLLPMRELWGASGSAPSFALVFAISIAGHQHPGHCPDPPRPRHPRHPLRTDRARRRRARGRAALHPALDRPGAGCR
jgi:Kef-type K+ transport system membrane component KefB